MNIAVATLLVALPVVAGAQAPVEAAAGASRAATTVAAPGQKVGKGIAGALEKLNRTLQDPEQDKKNSKATNATLPTARTRNPATDTSKTQESRSEKVPEVHYEPPLGIREGMDVADLSRRFGPPALRITTGSDQETYCYVEKDGTSVDVTVRGSKVVSVQTNGNRGSAGQVEQK